MLTKDAAVFIQFHHEQEQRILHRGGVVSVGTTLEAVYEEDLDLTIDQEVFVYYEERNKFFRHLAKVVEGPKIEEATSSVHVTLLGEPIPAESRECYRASTVMGEITMQIDEETNCKLLDVSATGFAVIAQTELPTGAAVSAKVEFDGSFFEGEAIVQSTTEVREGYRYGLHCHADNKTDGNLQRGLQLINMDVQRQQLRRLAGKA